MNEIDPQKLQALAMNIIALEANDYNTKKTSAQIIGEIIQKIEGVIK